MQAYPEASSLSPASSSSSGAGAGAVAGAAASSTTSVRTPTRKHVQKLSPIKSKAKPVSELTLQSVDVIPSADAASATTSSNKSQRPSSCSSPSSKDSAFSNSPPNPFKPKPSHAFTFKGALAPGKRHPASGHGSPSHLTPLMRNDFAYLQTLMTQAIGQQHLLAMEELLDAMLSFMESHELQLPKQTKLQYIELLRQYEQEMISLQEQTHQEEQSWRTRANHLMQQVVLLLTQRPFHKQQHEIDQLCHQVQEMYRKCHDPRYLCVSDLQRKFRADDLMHQANEVFQVKGDITAAITLAKQAQQHFELFCGSSHHQQALVLLSVSQAQVLQQQARQNRIDLQENEPHQVAALKGFSSVKGYAGNPMALSPSNAPKDWTEIFESYQQQLQDMKQMFDQGMESFFEQKATHQCDVLKQQMQTFLDKNQFLAAKQTLQQIVEICAFFHLQPPKHFEKWQNKIQNQKLSFEKAMFRTQVVDQLHKQLELCLSLASCCNPSDRGRGGEAAGTGAFILLPSLASLNDYQLALFVEEWLRELTTESSARMLLHDHSSNGSGSTSVLNMILKTAEYDVHIQTAVARIAQGSNKTESPIGVRSSFAVHGDFPGFLNGKSRFLAGMLALLERFEVQFASCLSECTVDQVLLCTCHLRMLQLVDQKAQKLTVLDLLLRQLSCKQTIFILLHKTTLLDQVIALKDSDGNHQDVMFAMMKLLTRVAVTSFPQFVGMLHKTPRTFVVVQQICARFIKDMALVTWCLQFMAVICQSDPMSAAGALLKACENGFCTTLHMMVEMYILPLKKLPKSKTKMGSLQVSHHANAPNSPPSTEANSATDLELDKQLSQVRHLVESLVVMVYSLCIGDLRAGKTLSKDKVISTLCQKSGVVIDWLLCAPVLPANESNAAPFDQLMTQSSIKPDQMRDNAVSMLQLFLPKIFDEWVRVQEPDADSNGESAAMSTASAQSNGRLSPGNSPAVDFLTTKKLPVRLLWESTTDATSETTQQAVQVVERATTAFVRFSLVFPCPGEKKKRVYELAKAHFGADGTTCTIEICPVSTWNTLDRKPPGSQQLLMQGIYTLKAARSAVDAFRKAMKSKTTSTRTQVFVEMKSAFVRVKTPNRMGRQ